jgi:hypothetical protein
MLKFSLRRSLIAATVCVTACTSFTAAQGTPRQPNVAPAAARPTPTPKADKIDASMMTKGGLATAEQVVELALIIYAYPGGRNQLNQIRKTTLERGTASITQPDGRVEQANYQRYVVRAKSLDEEKIRLDQEFPTARYSLVFKDGKIFGIYNNTVFQPREDAARSFQNQITRGVDSLLRYRENGSTISLVDKAKILGVDYYVIDLKDKQDRSTRYYVSQKTLRVMMLEYEEDGTKYRRRFYDYNNAQGTLVPFRSVLWAGDRVVEQIDIGTITFGQKVDESLFSAS